MEESRRSAALDLQQKRQDDDWAARRTEDKVEDRLAEED